MKRVVREHTITKILNSVHEHTSNNIEAMDTLMLILASLHATSTEKDYCDHEALGKYLVESLDLYAKKQS